MRKNYIDYLRVVGAIAVIMIHATARHFQMMDELGSPEWWLSNILNSMSRFSVPLFVMISGAVLLGKPMSTADFYKKRASRLIPPLIFWTIFFIAFKVYRGMSIKSLMWFLKVGLFVEGQAYYHLWYLVMFLCLMMFAPFINIFLNGNKPTRSDLLIFLMIVFLFFTLNGISSLGYALFDLKISWFKLFPWYIAYFIAGYWADKYGLEINISALFLAIVVVLLMMISAGLNYFVASSFGVLRSSVVLNNCGPLVFIITVSIFLFARKYSYSLKENKIITSISEASFGIYLIHPAFINIISHNINYISNKIISIPIVIVLTTVASFITIHSIRKVSFARTIC